jgi:hypothetical protein
VGYTEPNPIVITRPYREMQTSIILENLEGFRWDIFLKKVYGKLSLSSQMQNRATAIYQSGNLKILMASKEDLFLFKGITSREADLDDAGKLAQSGLNWDIIREECRCQSKVTGYCWEDALYQSLIGLKEKYGISSPIENELRKVAEHKIIEMTLINEIEKGNNTVASIVQAINEPDGFVRTALNGLVNNGLITIEASKKPYKYFLNKKTTSKTA